MRKLAFAPVVALLGASLLAAGTGATMAQEETEWKIAVLADVGSLDDRGFNEYTFEGASAAAAELGLAVPAAVVPKDDSEYGQLLEALIADGNNIIVTTGFNLGVATIVAAKANPDTWFIGVDQAPLCVTPEGDPDDTFTCAGDAASLLPNLIGLGYKEDQAGYLAGMAAADASENGRIGAIGGVTFCAPCVRYIQGYELGAKAINPDIEVRIAWVTDSDVSKAFYDQPGGKLFTQQFIELNQPDVVFQVAGQTGLGTIDAACEAGLYAIGVDVDQWGSYPAGQACTLTSAEKHLAVTTSATIQAIAAGEAQGGNLIYDASNDGIGASEIRPSDAVSEETKARMAEALEAMQAGELKTCPSKADGDPVDCGSLQ
jgi:basic membrane protein A and related proteins